MVVHLVAVFFDIVFGTMQTNFFGSEQNNAQRTLRTFFQLAQIVTSGKRNTNTYAIVDSAGTYIPAIQVRAQRDHLVGIFRTGDFPNHIRDGRGFALCIGIIHSNRKCHWLIAA